ncbi:MAG: TVP38/TMEM64 family protein [Pseudonocardia sp.]
MHEAGPGGRARRIGAWVRPALLVALVAAGVVVALTRGVPPVAELRSWVDAAGWAGPVLYTLLYAALTLTPAPASLLGIAGGVLFGLPLGLAVVFTGAMIGAVAGFGGARLLGRDTVLRFAGPRTRRLDDLVRRRGVLAVLAARLVPLVPFTTLNLACGLTAVRWRDYVLGTAVGILPAATAFVTIGAYGADPGSTPFLVAVGGLVVLAAGGLVAARRRRSTTGS